MRKHESKSKEELSVKFIKKVKPEPAKEIAGSAKGSTTLIRRGPACVPAGD